MCKEASMKMNFDTNIATFVTNEKKVITKFRKLIKECPKDVKFVSDDGEYVTIQFPATWFRLPRVIIHNVSDARRAELRKNAEKARTARLDRIYSTR